MKPLVSVIVPNYNHARFLEKRIQSILSQTFKGFEVILLDDASTDGSLEILRKYANHPLVSGFVPSDRNSGSPFGQWATGLSLSSGKYVWIAESDDFAAENFLEVLTCVLESNAEVGMVYCDSDVVDENDDIRMRNPDGALTPSSFEMTGEEFLQRYLYYKCAVPNVSGTLMRRQSIEATGFIPSNFRYVGDWMFWIRFFETGTGVRFVNQKLNYFRTHSGTTRSFSSLRKFGDYMIESFSVLHYSKRTGKADPVGIDARMDFLARKISNRFSLASLIGSDGRSLIRRLIPYDPKVTYRILRQKLVRR